MVEVCNFKTVSDCDVAVTAVPQLHTSLLSQSPTSLHPVETQPAVTSLPMEAKDASYGDGTLIFLRGTGSTTGAGILLGLTIGVLAGIAWL